MDAQQLTTGRIDDLPAELGSPQGKLVYLYLDATGGGTVDDLNRALAMNKMGVLSVLDSLSSRGLVEKNGSEYVVGSA
ncbi:MarR family transcriptional regulator [Natrarchaeobius chitinivorans]|uniref:MarR family transcriptional regulator n=1 Tax=Natrarchaeobius chitinivorans TaxID=1679083 RepID=A0A3N6M0Q1_NATCH|nr:MarR family transcriptional regulator [Natrarchaeobius chitinivorans]RQG95177.1 MarR family transcriptional regulator [Natrarchaeobius chitinivorans]